MRQRNIREFGQKLGVYGGKIPGKIEIRGKKKKNKEEKEEEEGGEGVGRKH